MKSGNNKAFEKIRVFRRNRKIKKDATSEIRGQPENPVNLEILEKLDIRQIRGCRGISGNHEISENGTVDKFGGAEEIWKITQSGKQDI